MFLALCLHFLLATIVCAVSEQPVLVVVSYDAFGYKYFERNLTPHMINLRKEGTYADFLYNVFPTKTFPNHHTIATGLYPENHGVVGNKYWNATTGKTMQICYEMFHYDETIVPIWRRNEDAGGGRYSGVMMWPGSAFPYQGKNVTYIQEYQTDLDWYRRVDMVISWIKNPEKPANLVMVYFDEPDRHGHPFGPDSKVIEDLLRKLDNVTQYLELQLQANDLTHKVNVIHLSDHGMYGVKPPNFLNISQYLTPNTYTMVGSSPIMQFIPKQGKELEVYEKLKKASINNHFKVYNKSEYLDRWHYKNNPRTPPIIVMSDVGYALDDLIEAAPKYAKAYNFTLTNDSEFGIHGYDNEVVESMRPIFMARGPKIKQNHKIAPFHTVDLYNLFCDLLAIKPNPNNGTKQAIKDIFASQNNGKYSRTSVLIITAGGLFIAFILISCAALITLLVIKRQQSITTNAALNKRFPQTFQSTIEAQHLLEPEDA